jgi:hypothetical protein
MDPTTAKTLQAQTVQTLSDAYFNSINDGNRTKLHLVESRQAGTEEIAQDVKTWFSGVLSLATMLGYDTNQLPHIEALLPTITKQFPEKAKGIAA